MPKPKFSCVEQLFDSKLVDQFVDDEDDVFDVLSLLRRDLVRDIIVQR